MIVEDIRFPAGDAALAGTLVLPPGEGAVPAVVLQSGSGHHDRDETVCGHKPLRVIADDLAARGIASLRLDDRGVGRSGGTIEQADFDMRVADLVAAWRHLAGDGRIRANRIALVGHSEGGLVAAAASLQIDAAVAMLAGPAIAIEDLLHAQARRMSGELGASPAQLAHERAMNARVFAVARAAGPADAVRARLAAVIEDALRGWPDVTWTSSAQIAETAQTMAAVVAAPDYRSLLRQDPAAILARVKRPILALYGERDCQVEAEPNRAGFDRATRGNPAAAAYILPELNHLFQRAVTGSIGEYESLGQSPDAAVLDRLADWLAAY